MSESLEDRYRRIPYAEFVHRQTHPANVGALARLFGLRCVEPQRARILELATGRGTNLNWIAGTLPDTDCLGVDLVQEGIVAARQQAEREGLANVTFDHGDLLAMDFGDRRFDYIIAHGFMAWTPEPVQQRILEVCRDHLAEGGVGLISYNAMPGSSTRDALRRLFLLELGQGAGDASADEQLGAMDRVMRVLEQTLPSIAELPHAADLRVNLEGLRAKPPQVLLHDEAGVVSEPLYLLQFTQWAAETGLAYVVDTDLRLDWMAGFPQPLRQAIVDQGMSRLKALQYADYLRNTMFRSSLVCRAEDAKGLLAMPDERALCELHVRSLLRPQDPLAVDGDWPERFAMTGPSLVPGEKSDAVIEVSDPLIKALLHELASTTGASAPFADVFDRALARRGGEPTDDDLPRTARFTLEAVCRGRMQLTLSPAPPLT